MTHRDDAGRVAVEALTLVVKDGISQPLQYALDELTSFCRQSPGIEVSRRSDGPAGAGIGVLVGRDVSARFMPSIRVDWDDLGDEGFVLHVVRSGDKPVVIAAGATDAGSRHAIYALMCQLDVTSSPPSLPGDMDLIEKPSFDLRGMYAHQHWAYNHPYALRTWTVDEWKQYVDMLALMRVSLFQIWSMAGILPVPLSNEDEAFLRRYPPVIDHARQNHGMEVWIGECANNMCDNREVPPIAERLYFDVECLKDPGDPAQMAELRAARAEYYKICNNADGYWVIDSDPGKWEGSPASEFVDILMMNRELINKHTRLGPDAKLVYWMWVGWGEREREDNWRDTCGELLARSPEPWWMTVAWEGHWKVVDELGLSDRIVYYPYGAVEPEPSLPFTTVVPKVINDVLDVPERVGKIRGAMGNAQTPVCQLPNMYYLTRAIWNMDFRNDDREQVVAELARLIYPQRADLITRCWMSLGNPEAPNAAALADELAGLIETESLGRPGPIGIKLFPDFAQVARDLVIQLRIHGVAMEFCRMAGDKKVTEDALLAQLTEYCMLSLQWRRLNGFRRFGTNGYDFFPLREAAHKHWWRGDHLDKKVYAAIEKAMRAQYDEWEAELVLYPLNH
jgi:hypothetical protein